MIWTAYFISAVCLCILLYAILFNFIFANKSAVRKEKKSVVETGSMFAFFAVMVLVVYFKVGELYINSILRLYSAFFGAAVIALGTLINIAGRLSLKKNWGNQIRIYENHSLVTTGIYRYIRHPLYSSTVFMMYGFSFLTTNAVVFALCTFVFLPFMIYRAKQEDTLLQITFKDTFTEYRSKTGMLLPKLRAHR